MNLARTRSLAAVVSITVVLTLATTASSVSAQACSCNNAFVGDTIEAADGVFIGTVVDQDIAADAHTTYEVETWIKGDVTATLVDVEPGECGSPGVEVGESVAVAFTLTGAGLAVETCALPSPSAVLAFVQPDERSTAPAVWLATSEIAPPLLLDVDGRIVASDPNADNRRIAAAAPCPDGRIAYLQDQQVVIVDADFVEIERHEFRRATDGLFCPEAGVVLAVAGPPQDKRVFDVESRSALTSTLAPARPADAVADLVAGGMQGPGQANATVRVVRRSTGVERTLIDPALLVGTRPVTIDSVRLSPNADRVAFTITSGPDGSQQAAAMVADTAGGSILALAEIDTPSEIRWLSGDRLVVVPATGTSTVRDAGTLSVERELDGRWMLDLDGDRLSGVGDSGSGDPASSSTFIRLDLPDGETTVVAKLPFDAQAIRVAEPVRPTTSGSAFVESLPIPLPSERLDGLVARSTTEGIVFVAPASEATTATPPSGEEDAEAARGTASTSAPAAVGDDAGILRWAVVAGAIAIGGVVLLLARPRSRPH